MPVFHSQKLIHLHVPRCGGTSINTVLWKRETNRLGTLSVKEANYHYLYGVHRLSPSSAFEMDHLDYVEVKRSVSPWIWTRYRKFAVVRHPWDRFVSEYRRKRHQSDRRFIAADCNFVDYCCAFLERIRGRNPLLQRRLGPSQFADSHFIPQWRFLGRTPDTRDPSVVLLRLETLYEDWPGFLTTAGLATEQYKLPQKNSQRGNHKDADFVIDPELGAAIESFYTHDYRLLGYMPVHGNTTPSEPKCL